MNRTGNPQSSFAKLLPVTFGGNRYVVNADFGLGQPVPLMVHGNAGFYLMLTHEIAEALNGGQPLTKVREYGYSAKGMGRFNPGPFRIGDFSFTPAGEIPVFDWPEEEGKAARGMLGIDFLTQEKVKIDFAGEIMEIGAPLLDAPNPELLAKGYSHTEFFVENSKAYMQVYFDALGRELPVTVGTVAESYSLDYFCFEGKVELEVTGAHDHSPNGTTPGVYQNVKPMPYRLANQLFEIPPGGAEFSSFAEYRNISQAELFPFGIFGRDWMKENNAVIDYANKMLYFKRDA